MKKIIAFLTVVTGVFCASAANENLKMRSLVQQLPTSSKESGKALPKKSDLQTDREKTKDKDLFVRIVYDDTTAHRVVKAPVYEGMEKLDKIERSDLTGEPISLQEFTYTGAGLPAVCYNKIVQQDGSSYIYSHFAYTYDSAGRATSAEEIFTDESMWGENVRYEYTYYGDSDQYASKTLFGVYGDTKTPIEKSEYEYDNYGYTSCETLYYWDPDAEEFYPVQKVELGYTPAGIGNRIFMYTWDRAANKWVGYVSGSNFNQTAEIDSEGRITELTTYTWENDDWLPYWKSVTTYNENGGIITQNQIYWNGTDWNGPYVAANGFPHYNVWESYEYDSEGRETLKKTEQASKDGSRVLIQEKHSSYKTLDNGEEECFSYPVDFSSQGAKYSTYTLTHSKSSGYYTFVQSGNFDGTTRVPNSENVYITNEHNVGLETIFYVYHDGKRLNDMRSISEYADDWDGIAEQPISTKLYSGDGTDAEDGWLPYCDYLYEWNNDALTKYEYAIYQDGTRFAIQGAEYGFDFSVAASDILRWTLIKDDDFGWDLYKELWNKTCVGNEYGEWDLYQSTYDTYIYSPFTSAIEDTVNDADITEIERFDISGRKLSSPVKGINIVKYSNGECKKIMVNH